MTPELSLTRRCSRPAATGAHGRAPQLCAAGLLSGRVVRQWNVGMVQTTNKREWMQVTSHRCSVVSRLIATALLSVAAGCASGLNSLQKQELLAYEARGLKVVEDNETAAAWWGIAPGGGSFYTGNVGYGIVNLLLWPLSICWDPVSGINGAESNNYAMTKHHVQQLQNAELDALEQKLRNKTIDLSEYTLDKESIMRKYRVP